MTLAVGDQVAYAKKFLKTIKTPATDPAWRRRAVVVAIGGQVTELYPHWRTKAPQAVPKDLVLIRWADEVYPIVHEDGETQYAHSVREDAIAKVGSARYAEDI